MVSFFASCAVLAVLDPAWKVLPIYGGGYMQNVVVCPSDERRLYTYVDVGGPYRSDDGGLSWRPLHGNYTPLQRKCDADMPRGLSVDPRDADSIVVAAGNSVSRPGGIFVSRDGGLSFRQTLYCRFSSNGRARFLGEVLVRNPFNPDELMCGENRDGLYRSRDNGETWHTLGLDGHWFTQICYDPDVKGRIYALSPAKSPTESPIRSQENIFGPYASGFFRSDDGGDTWSKLSEESPLEIAVIKGRREVLGGFRTAGGESWNENRISVDGGRSWRSWHQGLPEPPRGAVEIHAASSRGFRAFAALPDAFLCANGIGDIFKRRPEDAMWHKVERQSIAFDKPECETHLSGIDISLKMPALSSIIIDGRNHDRWFATDWNLIYETRNAGRDWNVRQNGIMQLCTHTLEFDPFSADNIFYGVADRGFLISNDGGKSFGTPQHPDGSGIPENHPYGCTARFSRITQGLLYAIGGKTDTPLYRSVDAGRSWCRAGCRGLPALKVGKFPAYGVVLSPKDDSVYLCLGGRLGDGGGVYRSVDNGETFQLFSNGLPQGKELFKSSEWDGCGSEALVFSPDGSAILKAPKIKKMFYLDGDVWKPCAANGHPVADPHVPGRFLFIGSPIVETTNGGRTLRKMPLLPMDCGSIAFDEHAKGLVAFNVGDRILVSRDGGRHSQVLPDGMSVPIGSGNCLYLDRGRLFARSPGSGVFVRDISSFSSGVKGLYPSGCPSNVKCIRSGQIWTDTSGYPINAHGGGVMHYKGKYYWYGEHKVYGNAGNWAHVGVHVYSSENLCDWKDEGIALSVDDDPASDVGDGCIIERPKVVFCRKTKRFVMYFHLEKRSRRAGLAAAGVAVSDSPTGPFSLVKVERPEGEDCRDMNLFVDDDGSCWHIFSSEGNETAHIVRLSDDYLSYAEPSYRIFVGDRSEAMALFKRNGMYWCICSGCSGWAPNEARYYRADCLAGPWKRMGNPCTGINPQNGLGPKKTWGGQSAAVFQIEGTNRFVAMFDMWNPKNQIGSRYIWQEIVFTGDGIEIPWRTEWRTAE